MVDVFRSAANGRHGETSEATFDKIGFHSDLRSIEDNLDARYENRFRVLKTEQSRTAEDVRCWPQTRWIGMLRSLHAGVSIALHNNIRNCEI